MAIISIEMPGMSEGVARADALLAACAGPRSRAAAVLSRLLAFLWWRRGDPPDDRAPRGSRGFAYADKRLRAPLEITRPGGTVAGFMIAIWLLAIYTFYVAMLVYGLQVKQAYPSFVAPRVRVGTFTIVYATVTFFVILYLTRRWGWKVALASAVIGTAAAWNIFEFPFDLIIMTRTNPPIPTHPMLYRQLYFLPLFLVEFSTVSLLTLLPSMRVTAYAAYAVAGMFVVFAVWAAFGFGFPAEPLPLALNVISKILCFVAAIMLFVWRAAGEVSGLATA